MQCSALAVSFAMNTIESTYHLHRHLSLTTLSHVCMDVVQCGVERTYSAQIIFTSSNGIYIFSVCLYVNWYIIACMPGGRFWARIHSHMSPPSNVIIVGLSMLRL